MIKLLGSVLVAGAAAWLGFRAAARLKGQVRALEEMTAGLELLEQELELSAPELRVLMERLGRRTRGAARVLFSNYARALEEMDAQSPGQLWERCVTGLEELPARGKVCLSPLGEVLGRYDSREQRACVAAVRARMESLRGEEERRCGERCRTCQTIGLSGGAFLIVLLL